MKRGTMTYSFAHRPNSFLKAVASTTEVLCDNSARAQPPSGQDPFAMGGVGMRSDRIGSIFSFAQHTSAECARGITILDGRRLGRTKDWCARQDRFGLICEGVAVQGVRNSEFPHYCVRKLAGHMCYSAPEIAGRLSDIPSVLGPAMSISQYLDHRAFPSW